MVSSLSLLLYPRCPPTTFLTDLGPFTNTGISSSSAETIDESSQSVVAGLVCFLPPYSSPSPDNKVPIELTWGPFTNTGISSSSVETTEASSQESVVSVFLLLLPRHLPDNNLLLDLSFDSLAPRTLVPSLLLLLLIPSSGEKHDFFSGCNAFSRKKMNSLNNSRKITAAITKWPVFT